MKKCEEYELAISSYVDGEIAQDERAPLFHHLASCEQCNGFLHDAIQIRIDAARESRFSAPTELGFPVVPQRSIATSPYSPDAPAKAPAVRQIKGRSTVSTIVLIFLTVFLFGLILSTKVEVQVKSEYVPSSSIVK
jgi:anti-sigma factor RsiW